MKSAKLLIAAALLALPVQAIAEPLCATLKAVKPFAEKDKFMSALKTGEGKVGEWPASKQVDGYRCVITTGTTSTMTRGFFNCTWTGSLETRPNEAALVAIGKCLGVAPTVQKKSYATSTMFELRATPRMWVVVNVFNSRPHSISLIAE
ncbi:MAG: hypothetical protein EOP62_09265 [Sphingomonadales bacterium]|nr:MAG: hypothetical protein EOP62_09265 [Sphingomonadales bacterium]